MIEELNKLSGNIEGVLEKQKKIEAVQKEQGEFIERITKKQGRATLRGGNYDNVTLKSVLAEAFAANYECYKEEKAGEQKFQTKDFLLSGALTGGVFQSTSPTAPLYPKWTFHLSSLVPFVPVDTGSVNVPVQNYPSSTGSFGKSTEGSLKANVNFSVTNRLVALRYLAAYTRVSRESSIDLPYLAGLLSGELAELFQQSLDADIVANIVAVATAGNSGLTVPAEKLIDNIIQLVTAGHTPTAIVASPASWATLIRTKPNDYGLPGGYVYDAGGNLVIAGLPVLVSNAVTSGKVIVGDFERGIGVFQNEAFNIVRTEFATNPANGVSDFTSNMVTWRAESRLATVVLSNDSFVYASV